MRGKGGLVQISKMVSVLNLIGDIFKPIREWNINEVVSQFQLIFGTGPLL